MRLVIDVHHMLDRKLRVALRGRQALVPEQFLNCAQIGSLFEHVCSKRVPQSVRMNFGRQSLGHCDSFDDATDTTRGEASAALVNQQRRRAFFGRRFFSARSAA